MNLYLVTRTTPHDYDEYDSFVCAAPSEHVARTLHPDGHTRWESHDTWEFKLDTEYPKESWFWTTADGKILDRSDDSSWTDPSQADVTFLGIAAPIYLVPSVILASFDAG